MNIVLKWLLGIFTAIVLLLIVAAIALPLLIDPNDYKQEITSAVQTKTGRNLEIKGDIKWSVFPWIGLDLNDVRLSNPAGFGNEPMLTAGDVAVSVRLLPLFHGALEIGSIDLEGLSVLLVRHANGAANWDDLISASSKPAPRGGGAHPFKLAKLNISQADITWNDAGQVTLLKDVSVTASGIEPGRPFDLKGGFSLKLEEAALEGRMDFGGRVLQSAGGERYQINGLTMSFRGRQGSGSEAVNLDLGVKANAAIDLGADQAELNDLTMHLYKLVLRGQMTVKSLSAAPRLAGSLKLDEFSPRGLLDAMGIGAPATQNADALASMSGEMRIDGSPDRIDVRDLRLKLDHSTATGGLSLENFNDPKLGFDIKLDQMDLDDYMTKTQTGSGTAGTAGTPASTATPTSLVPPFRIAGKLQIGQLKLAGLKATQAELTVNSDGKRLRVYPVNARIYNGSLTADTAIDTRSGHPILTASQQLTNVEAGPLLQDLAGTARLTGRGNFKLDIHTDLSDARSTRQDLSGRFALDVHDGAIAGIDITETLKKANALLGRQAATTSATGQTKQTEFSQLSMTGTIKQGIVSSDDLLLDSPLMHVTGKGRVDLVNETVDYEIAPKLEGKAVDELGPQLDKIRGVPIPIRLSGSLYKPSVKVDIAAALTGAQKAKITAKGKALEKKVLGKLLGEKDAGKTSEAGQGGDSQLQDSGGAEKQDNKTQAEELLKSLFKSKPKKDEQDSSKDGGTRP